MTTFEIPKHWPLLIGGRLTELTYSITSSKKDPEVIEVIEMGLLFRALNELSKNILKS
jgi:hypothetical protein